MRALRRAAAGRPGPEALAHAVAEVATAGLVARAGGVDGLARALANPALGPLADAVATALEDPETLPGVARVRLVVRDGAGVTARFLLACARGRDGRWRLSGLRREEAGWT